MSRRHSDSPRQSDAAYTRPGPAGEGVGWLRRLGPFISRYRAAVIGTLILSVVAQTLIGLLPLIQQKIVDHSILTKQRPVGPMLVVLVLTGLLGFSANYGRRYFGAKVSVSIQHDLRLAIHRHLYELDFSRHDELSVGDVMSRATADLTLIQVFFFSVPMLVANVTLLIVALDGDVRALADPQPRHRRVRADLQLAGDPLSQPHLPRQLERPATVGHGRRCGRRSGHRRACGEGVRPGGSRVRPFDGSLARAVPVAHAHGPTELALLVDPAAAADARPTRRARRRGMAGARRAHHARRVPGVRQLHGADHHAGAHPLRRPRHCAAGARRFGTRLRAARSAATGGRRGRRRAA